VLLSSAAVEFGLFEAVEVLEFRANDVGADVTVVVSLMALYVKMFAL